MLNGTNQPETPNPFLDRMGKALIPDSTHIAKAVNYRSGITPTTHKSKLGRAGTGYDRRDPFVF